MADMKLAMKNKQSAALQALKLVYAECKNREIELKTSLDDMQVVALLKKQVKQYEESIEQYETGGRADRVQEQKNRLALIKSYLPKSLSDKELKDIIEETINTLEVASAKDIGSVIKTVQSRTAGSVDNRRLAELVKERLKNI